MYINVWQEITYTNPNLQRPHCWSLRMDKWFILTLYDGFNYSFMLGSKLNYARTKGTQKCGVALNICNEEPLNISNGNFLECNGPVGYKRPYFIMAIAMEIWSVGLDNTFAANYITIRWYSRLLWSFKRDDAFHLFLGRISVLSVCFTDTTNHVYFEYSYMTSISLLYKWQCSCIVPQGWCSLATRSALKHN